MSKVSEKQRAIRAEKARLRSKRNQQAASKKRTKVARPKIEREAATKPWKLPRLRFGSGGGSERARKRQEAQEAAQKERYPHILTKAEREAAERKERMLQSTKNSILNADLTKATVPDLRKAAQNLGVKGTSRMAKPALIAALKEKASE